MTANRPSPPERTRGPSPGGRFENSPPFQGWDCQLGEPVPKGRLNLCHKHGPKRSRLTFDGFSRPFGTRCLSDLNPAVNCRTIPKSPFGRVKPLVLCRVVAFFALWVVASSSRGAQPATTTPAHFESSIRPLLTEFCLTCHSTEKHKGDLDLERFTSLGEVKKYPKVWQAVVEQLASEEMPPKDKPQPTPSQRERLLAWVKSVLDDIALARAGDPGPVVLRRLSNAEYTYTIRDLTGVDSLDPTREFPVDSASGEGFMNVGHSLVMSPALVTKYLDAAKEVARHAVLLPDGVRFSPKQSRRDWTEELLAAIRATYREFTDNGGGTSVNLQGIRFDTKDGGVLPLDKYLEATLEWRTRRAGEEEAPTQSPNASISSLATQRGLSPKYATTLWCLLTSNQPSFLLDPVRARWRAAKPADAPALARDIAQWQHALWRFNSVGHIGKSNGPAAWMEPITPLQSKHEVRLTIPASPDVQDVTLYLAASDAGDGNTDDFVVWERPRLVAPGQPDLLLRDVRGLSEELSARRDRTLARTAEYLAAAAEAEAAPDKIDLRELANKHGVDADAFEAWLAYLGIGSAGPVKIEGHFTDTYQSAAGYDFIKGWGKSGTPNLAANSSDQHVRIPGNMKPHSVAVHPSPKLAAVIGWRSPIAGRFRVAATIQHAHPECGNGVTWSLELRHGGNRRRCARRERGETGGRREPVGPAGGPHLVAHRPARWKPLVRFDDRGSHAHERWGERARMEFGAGGFTGCAGRQSARGSVRQCRRLAFLHGTGQRRGARSRDTGRFAAGQVAGG